MDAYVSRPIRASGLNEPMERLVAERREAEGGDEPGAEAA